MIEGTHAGSVTHTATSADTDYNGISINDVSVTVLDNEGLIAWYHFDETGMGQAPGGKDAQDSSDNSNHGIAESSMTDSDWVSGILSNALDFDGTDDYVDMGNNTSLDITNAITIESPKSTGLVLVECNTVELCI